MGTGLPAPARYFPIEKGVYEVAPGLRTLVGPAFEIDAEFPNYRENKLRCRAERLSKYYAVSDYDARTRRAVDRFLVERLTAEHPRWFRREALPGGAAALDCALTGETLVLDGELRLQEVRRASGAETPSPDYADTFDALCSQVQEDVAVMRLSPSGEAGADPGASADAHPDWLAAIHLCSPSHWAAEDKIGKSFVDIHVPVPGIEKVNRAAGALLDAHVNKGPYQRFVWGFGTDDRLNHHPEPPPGWDARAWRGRTFALEPGSQGAELRPGSGRSPFILRVERQVLLGLAAHRAGVFLIRVSFIDGEEIRRNPRERELLRSALLSMNEDARAYKGLTESMAPLLDWLNAAGTSAR